MTAPTNSQVGAIAVINEQARHTSMMQGRCFDLSVELANTKAALTEITAMHNVLAQQVADLTKERDALKLKADGGGVA